MPAERGGGNVVKKKWGWRGELSGSLESKQMALVLLSALAIWSLLKLMTSSPMPAHQQTVAQDNNMCMLVGCGGNFFFLLACVYFGAVCAQMCKSGPVKM